MEVVYVLLAIFIVFLLAKPKRKAEIVKPRSESDKVYDNPTKEFKKASLKAVYETESVHVSDSNSAGSYKEQKEANLGSRNIDDQMINRRIEDKGENGIKPDVSERSKEVKIVEDKEETKGNAPVEASKVSATPKKALENLAQPLTEPQPQLWLTDFES